MELSAKAFLAAVSVVAAGLLSGSAAYAALPEFSKTLTVGNEPRSIAVGDLNNDSRPDLVTANPGSSDVSVLLATGSGNYGEVISSGAGIRPRSVAIADLNADGFRDLVIGRGGAGIDDEISVLLGDGTGSFGAPTGFPAALEPWSVATGKLNGDSFPDIAAVSGFSDKVSVLPGNGDGTFGAPVDYPVGEYPMSIATGDLNADSSPDLVTANADSDDISVLLSDGAGSFGPAGSFPVGNRPVTVTIGNLNGDGFPDLAAANEFDDNVSVLINDGTGSFDERTNLPTGDSPTSLAIDDLNAHNKPDLAVTSSAGDDKVSVLAGDGTGSFSAAVDFPVGDNPSSVAVGELDGDGLTDLAVSNRFSDTVSLLLTAPPPGTGTVDPRELGFGTRQVGVRSAPKTVTFSNPGISGIAFGSVKVDGLQPDDFTLQSDTCTSSTVPSLGSCQVEVAFTPGAAEHRDANLILYYGAGKYLVVPLNGTGIRFPDTIIDTGPSGTIRTGSATFTFHGDPAGITAKIMCSLDSAAFTDCSSPKAFTGLSDGFHTVAFRAEDAAGNQDQSPAGRSFTVDTSTVPTGKAKISRVVVSGPKKTKRGKKTAYRVKIGNTGKVAANGVKLKVSGKGVKAKKRVGKIAPGKTGKVKVRIKPGKPGKVKVTFKVTSRNAGTRTVKKRIKVR